MIAPPVPSKLNNARPLTRIDAVGALLECMRPAQWIKNGFVCAPLLFSGNLHSIHLALQACSAAVIFCLCASGTYLWNDSLDWKSDLVHPEKRHRPIPSGRLNPLVAAIFGSILLLSSVLWSLALGSQNAALLGGYVVLNILYTTRLKHVAILDLMCIAAGFVIRVLAGSYAIHVQASHWLLMCTFLLALFLGITKRRQEIVSLGDQATSHRRVLLQYNLPWLEQAATISSGTAIVAYALYTVSPETQARFGTDRLIYTLPFVIYGILRYLQLVHASTRTGNPTTALLTDKHLLGCVAGWVLTCIAVIYL